MQGKGIGTELLNSAEQDVKELGRSGLAVWGLSQKMWMNAFWFHKHGYEKVDQINWFVLLWKPFHKSVTPPKWIKSNFKQKLIPGKVKITSFFSGQCSSENSVYFQAKKAASEFNDRVVLETIDMSKLKNRKKYGFGWRLYINGENLFADYPPSYKQIKTKIQEHLKKI